MSAVNSDASDIRKRYKDERAPDPDSFRSKDPGNPYQNGQGGMNFPQPLPPPFRPITPAQPGAPDMTAGPVDFDGRMQNPNHNGGNEVRHSPHPTGLLQSPELFCPGQRAAQELQRYPGCPPTPQRASLYEATPKSPFLQPAPNQSFLPDISQPPHGSDTLQNTPKHSAVLDSGLLSPLPRANSLHHRQAVLQPINPPQINMVRTSSSSRPDEVHAYRPTALEPAQPVHRSDPALLEPAGLLQSIVPNLNSNSNPNLVARPANPYSVFQDIPLQGPSQAPPIPAFQNQPPPQNQSPPPIHIPSPGFSPPYQPAGHNSPPYPPGNVPAGLNSPPYPAGNLPAMQLPNPVPPAMHLLPPPLPLPASAPSPAAPPPPPPPIINKLEDDATRQTLGGFEVDFAELRLGKQIGSGAFGKVYRATWRGTEVAVKALTPSQMSPDVLAEFRKEVAVMSSLRHPNVVLFMGACTKPPDLCIVTEFLPRGSLWDVLHALPPVPIDWKLIVKMAMDIARGINYLHQNKPPILHRDLKSANLLVDDNFNVKVSDFGLSRVKAHTYTMTGNCGTYQWMAPEVIGSQRYTEKADVFSYGVVLWELLTRALPYGDLNPMQVAMAVLNQQLRPPIPPSTPPMFAKLIRSCWHQEMDKRPPFDQILTQLKYL